MNLVDCKTALKTLKSGLPIIFPTDTLPAIGCLPKFSNTIYKFKKRDINEIIKSSLFWISQWARFNSKLGAFLRD